MLVLFSAAMCLLLCAPGLKTAPRVVGLAALLCGLDTLVVTLPSWHWDWFNPGLGYNWAGKLFSLLLSAAVIYGLRWVSPAEVGLRPPAVHSWRVAGLVLAGFGLFQLVNGYSVRHHHPRPSPEALLYELTMPGLAEELFSRGILPGLLHRVFPRTLPFLGTRTSWGGVVSVVLFVLGHVFSFTGPLALLPKVHFTFELVTGIGLWGTLFLWARERTGSVWAAVAAHNLGNFCLYLGRWML